ncbi:MAG: hypothetical protein H0Z24_05790 [Thermosipho sp. (in: Bacteria)]|nr:hypothetical protein [Thermosipho sp. (in: thermotogales)]
MKIKFIKSTVTEVNVGDVVEFKDGDYYLLVQDTTVSSGINLKFLNLKDCRLYGFVSDFHRHVKRVIKKDNIVITNKEV